MTTKPVTGTSRTAVRILAPASYIPPHYLKRVARSIVLRAALRGRVSWHVALPLLNQIGQGCAMTGTTTPTERA